MEGGLLKADSLSSYAVSLLGGKEPQKLRLENLDIPIIVVQEDLVTKRQILVSEGDFATIFRASFAITVYFPSVEYKGHLLIDGGISNLAPINLAYEYSDDVIVSTTFNTVNDLNLKDPLTAINALVDIQKRRTGVQEITAHPEMVWIRCAVEKVSFMDFAGLEGIVQKGYEAAKSQSEALSKLPQTLGVVSMMKESALASFAAWATSSSVASGLPKRMFSAIVPVNRWVSWSTIPNDRLRSDLRILLMLMPSKRIFPSWMS